MLDIVGIPGSAGYIGGAHLFWEYSAMKITIDFDATPDEARRFFGMPDIAPMQEAIVAEMTEKMQASVKAMDVEQLWRQWMPAAGVGANAAGADIPGSMDAMRQFWEQAMRGAMTGGKPADKS